MLAAAALHIMQNLKPGVVPVAASVCIDCSKSAGVQFCRYMLRRPCCCCSEIVLKQRSEAVYQVAGSSTLSSTIRPVACDDLMLFS